MKIKRFNKSTLPVRDPGAPQLKVYSSGAISFNQAACDLIKLKVDGSGVEFIQDEERPKDWYVVLSESVAAFKVRPYKGTQGAVLQNSVLAKNILSSLRTRQDGFNAPEIKIAGLLIGSEPIEEGNESLWSIITSSYKPKTS